MLETKKKRAMGTMDYKNRRTFNPGTFSVRTTESSYASAPLTLALAAPELEYFKDTRVKEKSEMKELNSRLSDYIEMSRNKSILSSQLLNELEEAKAEIRQETTCLKGMYNAEMGQLRDILDDSEHEKNENKLAVENNEAVCGKLRSRISEYNDYETQDAATIKKLDVGLQDAVKKIDSLGHKQDLINSGKDKDKEMINKLRQEIEDAGNDLKNETLSRIDEQNKCQSLNEELEFMKDVHDRELKELKALANDDSFGMSPDQWNDEFSECIKEIQAEYESRIDEIHDEMNSFYECKVNDVQTNAMQSGNMSSGIVGQVDGLNDTNMQVKNQTSDLTQKNNMLKEKNANLKKAISELQMQLSTVAFEKANEMAEIRMTLESTLLELQVIVDDNMSLQMEIMSYGKLLSCEENRFGIQYSKNQSQDNNFEDLNIQEEQFAAAPKSFQESPKKPEERKVSYQRNGIEAISISDVNPNGLYITIENSNDYKNENMEGWQIVQNVDNVEKYTYTFGKCLLGAKKSINIWAEGSGPLDVGDLVWTNRCFLAIGNRVVTILLNEKGKEKASYIQKVSNY